MQLTIFFRCERDVYDDNVSAGKSPFGYIDETQLLNDGSLDQTVPNMSPSQGSPNSQERIEHYSRKVFVGGLPPDIDEG